MKKLPILLLSSLLLLGCVVGCGEETPSSTPGSETSQNGGGSNGGTTSQESLIKGVSIVDPGITEVMEGISGVKLDANVDGPSGSKVSWSSSNEDVATVRNGTVSFKKVEENTDVTITATSRDDSTKSDSVTFTVKDCVIDFTRSHGSYDALLFEEEGVIVEAGDSGLIFEEVYGTKWYVEAKVTLNELNDPAGFSKFGIFSGTNENAAWNGSIDANINKNAMFYVDAQKALENGGFNGFNFVGQNDTFTDWDWNNQVGFISVSNDDKVRMDQEFTMGLLRNGINYYLYLLKDLTLQCYKHVVYDGIAADEATYAWIGGWGTGYTARDFRAYVGDEVDQLYTQPTELQLNYTEQLMTLDSTLTLQPKTNQIVFDIDKVTYESSDEDVATVSKDGVVHAVNIGNAVITAKLGELTAECSILVSNANSAFDLDSRTGDWVFLHEVDEENPYVELLPDASSFGYNRKLLFKDVNDTKWYAQMTVQTIVPEGTMADGYPKSGLAAIGLNDSGDINNIVWYAQDYANFTNAMTLGEFTMKAGEWNWNTYDDNEYFDSAETVFNKASTMTYGLLRDGNTFYYFRDGNLIKVRDVDVFTDAEGNPTPSQVGFLNVGGMGAKVSNYFVKVGEEADEMLNSIKANVAVENTNWTRSGQVSVTDNATFKFGADEKAAGVKPGTNKLVWNEKLNGAWEVEYDISNFHGEVPSWYWPKAAVVVNGNMMCYAYRSAVNNTENHARFETYCFGNWQNSPDFGIASFDPLATHHVKITCTAAGQIAMYLDGTQIVLEGSDIYNRNIDYSGSNGTLEFISEYAGFEITNFTVTDNL